MLFCDHCYSLIVVLDSPERPLCTPQDFPSPVCPSCSSPMVWLQSVEEAMLPRLKVHELTDEECFRALHNQGLPDQAQCTPDLVKKYLEGARILDVSVLPVPGTTRSILQTVTLDTGTVVHLGVSSLGPTVFRIVRGPNG